MNKVIRIVIDVAAAGAGFCAGYVVAKKKYIKKVNDELAKVTSMRNEKTSDEVTVDPAKEVEADPNFKDSAADLKKRIAEDKKRNEELKKLYKEDIPEEEQLPPVKFDLKLITQEEFLSSERDSYTIYQYLDGELVDDEYNVLEKYTSEIGAELMQLFDSNPECTTLYFRDPVTDKDYEVLKCEKHLSEVA